MKVRMKVSIRGSFCGIPAKHIYSVERGDIIDLEPHLALHELRNNRCELTLTGPINDRDKPHGKELAALEAEVAAARRTAAMPGICGCGCGQVRRPGLHDKVSKIRRIAG